MGELRRRVGAFSHFDDLFLHAPYRLPRRPWQAPGSRGGVTGTGASSHIIPMTSVAGAGGIAAALACTGTLAAPRPRLCDRLTFAKHLKALRWRTPFQAIQEAWTSRYPSKSTRTSSSRDQTPRSRTRSRISCRSHVRVMLCPLLLVSCWQAFGRTSTTRGARKRRTRAPRSPGRYRMLRPRVT